jgi:hypothetical protein
MAAGDSVLDRCGVISCGGFPFTEFFGLLRQDSLGGSLSMTIFRNTDWPHRGTDFLSVFNFFR